MDPVREIRFDGWTLLPATGELLRDGIRARLQQQPLAVLLALLERPGELVAREALIGRLWPRGVVDFDTALNSAVRRLRTTLADHAESPRYIETIPRLGYRFIGKLDGPSMVGPQGPAPGPVALRVRKGIDRRWLAAAAAAALVVAAVTADQLVAGSRGAERIASATPVQVAAEARDRLLLAEHLYQRRGPGDLGRAMQLYEAALAVQPDYPEALAGLASVYWIQTVEGLVDPEQGLSRLRDAAERALALDPGLAQAHLRLSQYRAMVGDHKESAWHANMAAALQPEDPLVLAFAASREASGGRLDQAISLQRRALELEPLSGVARYNLAWFLLMDGRIEEAGEQARAHLELRPDASEPNEALTTVLVLEGRAAEACELAKAWPEGRERLQVLAIAHQELGDRPASEQALEELIACCGAEDPYRVAEVLGAWGDRDAAFAWLGRGLGAVPRQPWEAGPRREAWMVVHSPFLSSLHEDPRWGDWVSAVRVVPSPDRMAARR